MARDVEHVEGIVDWIHPIDRNIKDFKKPHLWSHEEDAMSFDLKVLTGVDFLRLESMRGQLSQEGVNFMARAHAVTRDIVETYVDNPRHYSVPLTTKGRAQAAELFSLSFPVDQERYRPKNGKELWIACAICPGHEYQEVLEPIVVALQNASILSVGARKKSLSQFGTGSGGTKSPKDSDAQDAGSPNPEVHTSQKPNGDGSVTATV